MPGLRACSASSMRMPPAAAEAVKAWLGALPGPVRATIGAISTGWGLAACEKAARAKAEHAAVTLDPFRATRWAGEKVSAIGSPWPSAPSHAAEEQARGFP